MDNPNLPNQPITTPPLPPPQIQPQKPQNTKLIVLISILVLLVIGIFLTLKFFKKTSTPAITKNQTVPQSTPTPILAPHMASQAAARKLTLDHSITIPCPSIPEFCKNPKKITNDEGGGVAIGNNIKAGSPIYAVLDGQSKLRTAIVDGEQFLEIDLISSQNSLRAYYFLKKIEGDQGSLSIQNSFKKGEVITTVTAEPIKYFGNYNLVFKFFDNDREIPSEKVIFE